jgi:hypothetical protein
MGKKLGELWRALSDEERTVWQGAAAKAKAEMVGSYSMLIVGRGWAATC